MIERYTLPEMASIWSLENKYRKWLDVELSVCKAMADEGDIPYDAYRVIKNKAGFDIKRIAEIEATVKHDVIAFLTSTAEHVGHEARFIHKGLTSSDVLDTALALQMRDASDIIIKDIKTLMETLKKQAFKYKDTVSIGRSHGVHAEPITFGLKFGIWYEDMKRNLRRIKEARDIVSVGKLSGAVGTFSNIKPHIEEKALKMLSLKPDAISTQVIQRDRHAQYLLSLALIAAGVEKISVELRHLQRTEVLEAEEPFTKGQKGSSAMPHKRNPVGCENLTGLSRVVRANASSSLENIALWHERDISHSSVERIIIPDSSILIDYMLQRLNGILHGIHVYPQRMMENMKLSYGLYNSQRVLISLIEKGMSREDAYGAVQRIAMQSWKRKTDFKRLLTADKEIRKYLNAKEIKSLFDLSHYLKNVDYIFKRVFGKGK